MQQIPARSQRNHTVNTFSSSSVSASVLLPNNVSSRYTFKRNCTTYFTEVVNIKGVFICDKWG